MAKKFVVRLRKGSPSGNIVANSQVITIDPLAGGTIFPSNFTDGRLQGKVTTLDRVANFIKAVIPRPTTSTTSTTTTRAPSAGTTTTTTSPPSSGTTTTTTTKGRTIYTQYKIETTKLSFTEGETVTVKCYLTAEHPTDRVWLAIRQKNIGTTFRPDIASILSPTSWVIGEETAGIIGYKLAADTYYQEITFSIKKSLSWLATDLDFVFELYKGSTTNPIPTANLGRSAFLAVKLTRPDRQISILNGSTEQTYFLPGQTMTIRLQGLDSGTKYAVALQRKLGTRPKSTDVTTSFIPASDAFAEGWTQGGQSTGLFTTTPNNWWYTFTGTTNTKNINLTFASSVTFDQGKAAYPFDIDVYKINEVPGKTSIDSLPLLQSLNNELLSTSQVFNSYMQTPNAVILEGSDQSAKLNIETLRRFVSEDNINYVTIVVRPGDSNPNTLNGTVFTGELTISSTSTITIQNNNTLPGVFNYRYNMSADSKAIWTGDNAKILKLTIPTATSGSQGGNARITVYASSTTTIDDTKIVSNIPLAFIVADKSFPPTITNWRPNPSSNQINEVLAKTFSVVFTLTDTVVRTIYWSVIGIGVTDADFDGPYYGNFASKVGATEVEGGFKLRNDNTVEPDEKMSVAFYLTQTDFDNRSNAFYTSPIITVSDGTNLVNEKVSIASADIPPYYKGDSITFIITGGVPNDKVDMTDGTTTYPSVTLDASGNFTVRTGPFNDIREWQLTLFFNATKHERTVSWSILPRPILIETPTPPVTGGIGSLPGCPDPETPIMISPTESKSAKLLTVGDMVWTMHEHSLEYGFFAITHAEESEQPKIKFTFDDNTILIVSLSHKFLGVNNEWIIAKDVRQGQKIEGLAVAKTVTSISKQGVGTVIKLEVDQAHTYIANGCISHNKVLNENVNFQLR